MGQKYVVMFSGGATSWATAKRVAERYGTEGMVLLFADTLAEDEDLHRFLAEASADVGVPVTRVCDGRTPEQVDVDRRWLSNSRVAQCSLELKVKPSRQWLHDNASPADTTVYVGVDWSEMHRIPGIRAGYAHTLPGNTCTARDRCSFLFDHEGRRPGPGCSGLLAEPWQVEFPLVEPPYVDKDGWFRELRARGIEPPRLNLLGYPHNNCGGTCIRGGKDYFLHTLRVFPDRFAAKESHEQRMRELLGEDVTILRESVGGVVRNLPLTVLRQRAESKAAAEPTLFEGNDWGGCGCFLGETA